MADISVNTMATIEYYKEALRLCQQEKDYSVSQLSEERKQRSEERKNNAKQFQDLWNEKTMLKHEVARLEQTLILSCKTGAGMQTAKPPASVLPEVYQAALAKIQTLVIENERLKNICDKLRKEVASQKQTLVQAAKPPAGVSPEVHQKALAEIQTLRSENEQLSGRRFVPYASGAAGLVTGAAATALAMRTTGPKRERDAKQGRARTPAKRKSAATKRGGLPRGVTRDKKGRFISKKR